MSKVVQEKFQVNQLNPADKDPGPWVSDKSARVKKGVPGREMTGQSMAEEVYFFQSLPPGMDITDQEMADIRMQPYGGSLGSGSQVTDDVTSQSAKAGFDRKSFTPTDDMFSREHQDAFYDEATVDGITGYLERNNVLDRS